MSRLFSVHMDKTEQKAKLLSTLFFGDKSLLEAVIFFEDGFSESVQECLEGAF